MVLINLSNHPSSKWSIEQKSGFENILDLSFPNVDPHLEEESVYKMVEDFKNKILELKNMYCNVVVCLMGEYTFCYLLFLELKKVGIDVVIPTTERLTKENIKENGEVEKISVFKFVRWRKV